MVDYYNKKFAYTSGDIFTLTGANYTGYFNVLSGESYTGLDQIVKLSNISNYKNDVYTGSLLFDRTLGETLNLPHSLADISINSNEFITADRFNDALKRINDNNIYLYSRCFIYNGNSPSNITATICVTGENSSLDWFTGTQVVSTFDFDAAFQTNPYSLQDVVDVEIVIDVNDDYFALFTPTSTKLIVLTGSIVANTIGVALSTQYVSDKVNEILSFGNITSITSNNNNLFVCDQQNNSIYKYSVEGFIANDPGFASKRFILETIGTNTSKSGVKRPKFITSSDESVFVYNEQSKFFVEYDNNFNVRNVSKLLSSREQVLCIGYNRFYNTLCILSSSSKGKTISFYDNFKLVQQESIIFELGADEIPLKIVFSKNDSNIFYIITTQFIYKKILSNIGKTISVFNDERMNIVNTSGKFTGLTIHPTANNYDLMFVGKQDRLIFIQEQNNFNTVLRGVNVDNYDITSINIKQDEYIQSNYINKEIYKVLANLFKLKNQYLGRFLVEYTAPNNNLTYAQSLLGENLIYKGYTYLDDYNFLDIGNINDYYVHENEKVTASVINRCIKNIYNLQLAMLQQSEQKNKTLVQYLTTGSTLVVS